MFGLLQGRPFLTATMTVSPTVTAETVHVQCESQLVTVSVSHSNDAAKRYTLAVLPSAKLPLGRFNIPVSVIVEDQNGVRLPSTSLQLVGTVETDIHAIPSEIDFGVTRAGKIVSRSLTLQSHLETEFQVTVLRAADSETEVLVDHPGFALRHDVELRGTFRGQGGLARTVELSIKTRTGDTSKMLVPLTAYLATAELTPPVKGAGTSK